MPYSHTAWRDPLYPDDCLGAVSTLAGYTGNHDGDPQGEKRFRANARFNEQPIEDPKSYQDFFATLDKAMFLTLHEID
jgi:hypothetical protein